MIELSASNYYSYVEDLWIITTYFNSCNYQTKLKNITVFKERIESARLNLIIVECAFRDQIFTLSNSSEHTIIIKVKATDVMWQKERLLNIALSKLPTSCKKVAWIDCDILFNNSEWALEASKLLDVFPVVQLFDIGIRLPKDQEIYRGEGEIWKSFASIYKDNPDQVYNGYRQHGHTGFAWAARKDLLLKHKFYDASIVGGGDELMVHAMCGAWYSICVTRNLGRSKYHFNYFINWAENFYEDVLGKVGCVSGSILHLWHGNSEKRQHFERNVQLHISVFDPENDIAIDENGCWKWNSDKPHMHQWIKEYFSQRKEDGDEQVRLNNKDQIKMTVTSPQSPRVFLLNADKLMQVKESRTSGDGIFDSAINQLSQMSDKALKDRLFRVGERPQSDAPLSPSKDKHDYFSLAPYWWPNPNTPDGLPYIRRDGERNPDIDKIPDAKNLNGMVNSVARLTLAYYFTGKEVYAKYAADLLRTWFLTENTRMNPNMAYAQVIMGKDDGRGTKIGIIQAHGFIYVVDSIGLLAESKDWTLNDQQEIQQWFSQYLEWLLTTDNGKGEAEASNNHATWYAAQAAAIALFLDKKEIVIQCLQRIQALIAHQIQPDGQQPLETDKRTKPWYYSVFNLNGLFHVAALAERVGIDLWNYRTEDDRSIRKALDYLVPFVLNPSKWPYKKDISKNIGKDKNITVLLRQGSVRYQNQQYLEISHKSYQLDELDKLNMLIGWCVREAWD